MNAKGFHELVFVIEHCQVVFTDQFFLAAEGTGREHAGNGNLVEVGLDKAAFPVCLLIGKAIHDGLGK